MISGMIRKELIFCFVFSLNKEASRSARCSAYFEKFLPLSFCVDSIDWIFGLGSLRDRTTETCQWL